MEPALVQSYRWPAKLFHWLTALAVVTAIVLGFAMVSAQPGPRQNQLYDLHRSFGALILALTGARLLWRLFSPPPRLVPGMPKWQKTAATAMHRLLYVILIAMPLLGWAGTSAFPATITVFGLFELPPLVAPNRELSTILLGIHWRLAWLLCVLIAGHIAAALYHHFVVRDETLRRMLP
ncbi:MAG: cytochrome b [Rhodospirillaceae bacterium]